MMPRSYTISLNGLKEGHHIYDFKIDNEFFDQFEESEIEDGSIVVNIEMDKMSTHLDLTIRMLGGVKISCDRCLEVFYQQIDCENRLLVKYGNDTDITDPEIFTIPIDEYELDLQQHFYEYIHLALPIKRVHPDDNEGKSTCDPLMLDKLDEFTVESEEVLDPRWEELKKLTNYN
jgi:DUF177 domain-containing protein